MSTVALILIHLSILAYAMLGGVFLAFSDFLMRALVRTRGPGGPEAMQAINREVYRWIFMPLFLGMCALSVALLAYGALRLTGGPAIFTMLGALAYLLGCFAVTAAVNVPLNETLARMDPAAEATSDYWSRTYVPRWTRWNTVRALACALAAGMLLAGLGCQTAAHLSPG